MKDTCMKELCEWWKEHGEKCPMYITTVWDDIDHPGTTKTVSDCAPKRNTVMLMDYSSRAIGIQQDYEEQRNKYDQLIKDMSKVILELEKRNQALKLIDK